MECRSGRRLCCVRGGDLVNFKPVSQDQLDLIRNNPAMSIDLAESLNNETLVQLDTFSRLSHDRWQSIKYSRYGYEQLFIWAGIASNLLLSLLLALCIARTSCKTPSSQVIINGKEDNNSVSIKIAELRDRLVGLEGELLCLQSIPMSESTLF